jgi:hypothetical protein
VSVAALALGLWCVTPAAQIPQGVFTEVFPPEEFAARRARVMAEIALIKKR